LGEISGALTLFQKIFRYYNAERSDFMDGKALKGIIFALIAAGISGIVGEGVERGLNAADDKFQRWKHRDDEEENASEDETEQNDE
jgi:hypothetical protein